MCYYLIPVDDDESSSIGSSTEEEEEEKRETLLQKKGGVTTRSKGSSLQALAKDGKGGTVNTYSIIFINIDSWYIACMH